MGLTRKHMIDAILPASRGGKGVHAIHKFDYSDWRYARDVKLWHIPFPSEEARERAFEFVSDPDPDGIGWQVYDAIHRLKTEHWFDASDDGGWNWKAAHGSAKDPDAEVLFGGRSGGWLYLDGNALIRDLSGETRESLTETDYDELTWLYNVVTDFNRLVDLCVSEFVYYCSDYRIVETEETIVKTVRRRVVHKDEVDDTPEPTPEPSSGAPVYAEGTAEHATA